MRSKTWLRFSPVIVLMVGAVSVEAGAQLSYEVSAESVAPSRSIDSCRQISEPGFYQVRNNIGAPFPSVCLDVIVDDVVIDLGGFVVSGPGGAIAGSATRGVTIKNGTIGGSTVQLRNTENVRLIGVTVVPGGGGVFPSGGVRLGPGAFVSDCVFAEPGAGSEPGTVLSVGPGSIVRDSTIGHFSQPPFATVGVGSGSLVLNNIVDPFGSVFSNVGVGKNSLIVGNRLSDGHPGEGGTPRIDAQSTIVNNGLFGTGPPNDPRTEIECPNNFVGNYMGGPYSSFDLEELEQRQCSFSDNLVRIQP